MGDLADGLEVYEEKPIIKKEYVYKIAKTVWVIPPHFIETLFNEGMDIINKGVSYLARGISNIMSMCGISKFDVDMDVNVTVTGEVKHIDYLQWKYGGSPVKAVSSDGSEIKLEHIYYWHLLIIYKELVNVLSGEYEGSDEIEELIKQGGEEMKYLIFDEEGTVFWSDELDKGIIDMVKGGYWRVIDLENRKVGGPNSDWSDIEWKNIMNRKEYEDF